MNRKKKKKKKFKIFEVKPRSYWDQIMIMS